MTVRRLHEQTRLKRFQLFHRFSIAIEQGDKALQNPVMVQCANIKYPIASFREIGTSKNCTHSLLIIGGFASRSGQAPNGYHAGLGVRCAKDVPSQ